MRRSSAPSQGLASKRTKFCPPFSNRPNTNTQKGINEETNLTSNESKENVVDGDSRDLLKIFESSELNTFESDDIYKGSSPPPPSFIKTPNSSKNFRPPSLFNVKNEANNVDPKRAQYFNVMWCKQSTRKHKKWEGDGILTISGRTATLQDIEGKEICRAVGYKAKEFEELEEGSNLKIGGKEVEICDAIQCTDFASGKCFNSQVQSQSVLSTKVFKPFMPPSKDPVSTLKKARRTTTSLYSIDAPGALIMPRPPAAHQWEFNKNQLDVIDVVVDPHVGRKLRPHQREGIIFLYECVMGFRNPSCLGAILADDMGLGKTLQCIALIWMLFKQGPYGGMPVVKKILIVTPSSLVKNWLKEFRQWLGSERLSVYGVDQNNKLQTFMNSSLFSVLIISYEMFMRSIDTLRKVKFGLVICDEGHRLKNTTIKTTTAISSIKTKRRIVLTGTPIQNDLQEFFSIIEFCNPGILGSKIMFKKVYEDPILKSNQSDVCHEEKELGESRAAELYRLISSFILRRTSEVIDKYLPPKCEMVVMCKPSKLQVSLYKRILSSRFLNNFLHGIENNGSWHLICISALKKLCNHPSLLYEKSADARDYKLESDSLYQDLFALFPSDYDPKSAEVCHSGKLSVVSKLLKQIHQSENVEKIVLVSSYTQTLDLLGNFCKENNYETLRLDGSTPSTQRQNIVDNFNNKFSKQTVFLLSSKAGGVGLNLIGASRILLYDIDWNPATDLQAMARVWRDGQKRKVFVYRLLIAGSIEEKIYQRQMSKQAISGSVVDMKDFSKTQFTVSDLKDIFSFQENCPSSTHDLLECHCDQNGETPSQDGSNKANDDTRPCQLVPPSSLNSSKKISMAELMDWKHICSPIPDGVIEWEESDVRNEHDEESGELEEIWDKRHLNGMDDTFSGGPIDIEDDAWDNIYLWDTESINYKFDKKLPRKYRRMVVQAMRNWKKRTCISFKKERRNQRNRRNRRNRRKKSRNVQKLYFTNRHEGCASFVGRSSFKMQPVNLDPACASIEVVTDLIGHALGFYHDKYMDDTTVYVHVRVRNFHPQILYFAPIEDEEFSNEMDSEFKNGKKKQKHKVSFDFAKKASIWYCEDWYQQHCGKQTPKTCNKGYLGPNCKCNCPANTKGKTCRSSKKKCMKMITKPGIYELETVVIKLPKRQEGCAYIIESHKTMDVVQLEFQGISSGKLNQKLVKSWVMKAWLNCVYGTVVFEYRDIEERVCVEELLGKKYISDGHSFVMRYIPQTKLRLKPITIQFDVKFISSSVITSTEEPITKTTTKSITFRPSTKTTQVTSTIRPTLGPDSKSTTGKRPQTTTLGTTPHYLTTMGVSNSTLYYETTTLGPSTTSGEPISKSNYETTTVEQSSTSTLWPTLKPEFETTTEDEPSTSSVEPTSTTVEPSTTSIDYTEIPDNKTTTLGPSTAGVEITSSPDYKSTTEELLSSTSIELTSASNNETTTTKEPSETSFEPSSTVEPHTTSIEPTDVPDNETTTVEPAKSSVKPTLTPKYEKTTEEETSTTSVKPTSAPDNETMTSSAETRTTIGVSSPKPDFKTTTAEGPSTASTGTTLSPVKETKTTMRPPTAASTSTTIKPTTKLLTPFVVPPPTVTAKPDEEFKFYKDKLKCGHDAGTFIMHDFKSSTVSGSGLLNCTINFIGVKNSTVFAILVKTVKLSNSDYDKCDRSKIIVKNRKNFKESAFWRLYIEVPDPRVSISHFCTDNNSTRKVYLKVLTMKFLIVLILNITATSLLVDAVAFSGSCIESGTTGVCLTANGCGASSSIGDCDSGFICCHTANLQGVGGVCDSSATVHGVCIDSFSCDGPPNILTCATGVYCCGDLPDVGSTCSVSNDICALDDNCDGNAVNSFCETGVCCAQIDLPQVGRLCGRDFTSQGTCLMPGNCPAVDQLIGTYCQAGLVCCEFIIPFLGDCVDDSFTGSGTCAANCGDGAATQGNCGAGFQCCNEISLPGVGSTCADNSNAAGVCTSNGGCGGATATQGDCMPDGICCQATDVLKTFEEVCDDGTGTAGKCMLNCGDPSSPQGDCATPYKCCSSLPILGAVCDASATESGVCIDSFNCEAFPNVNTCTTGLFCCSDLNDIGQSCSNNVDICAFDDHCDGAIVNNFCEEGICCAQTDLPAENELCGLNFVNEGECKLAANCPDAMELIGTLCDAGLRCCKREIESGGDCVDANENNGKCIVTDECFDLAATQGNCVSGFICCQAAQIIQEEGSECVKGNGDPGICAPGCISCDLERSNCACGTTCCSPNDLPGIGEPCAYGGTCQVGCSAGEDYPVGKCSTGLTCCIPGLNMDCSFTRWGVLKTAVCELWKDCKKIKGRKNYGCKTCDCSRFRCCSPE